MSNILNWLVKRNKVYLQIIMNEKNKSIIFFIKLVFQY